MPTPDSKPRPSHTVYAVDNGLRLGELVVVEGQQNVFSALIPSLTTQKIDIISAAMLKTPARQQIVDFSDTVYSYGEGLVVKADDKGHYTSMDDFKGEVVGAQVGTAFVDALNKKGIFKEVRTYDSVADIMRACNPFEGALYKEAW